MPPCADGRTRLNTEETKGTEVHEGEEKSMAGGAYGVRPYNSLPARSI